MKKKILILLAVSAGIMFTISSCTKEQLALAILYGGWRLDSQLDDQGILITPPSGTTQENIITFFRCNSNDNQLCLGTSKTTTTVTGFPANIYCFDFYYMVYQKTQLVMGGDCYEIEEITKKTLRIHPCDEPLATRTYSSF